jgi:hypothetical protein
VQERLRPSEVFLGLVELGPLSVQLVGEPLNQVAERLGVLIALLQQPALDLGQILGRRAA